MWLGLVDSYPYEKLVVQSSCGNHVIGWKSCDVKEEKTGNPGMNLHWTLLLCFPSPHFPQLHCAISVTSFRHKSIVKEDTELWQINSHMQLEAQRFVLVGLRLRFGSVGNQWYWKHSLPIKPYIHPHSLNWSNDFRRSYVFVRRNLHFNSNFKTLFCFFMLLTMVTTLYSKSLNNWTFIHND